MTTEPQGWIAALANMAPRHRSDTRPAAPVVPDPPSPEGELHEYVAETRRHYRYDTCGICGSGVNDSSKHPVPIYVHSRNPAPTSEGQEAGRVSACRRDKDEYTALNDLATHLRAAVPERTDEHGPAYWNGIEDGYEQAARFIEQRIGER